MQSKPLEASCSRRRPFDKLPNELLGYIFSLGTRGEYGRDASRSQAQVDFAVRVSHVCPRWREIALTMSSLWTDISFSFAERLPFTKSRVYLERSRNAPIDVSIRIADVHAGFDDVVGADNPELLDALSSEISVMMEMFTLIIPHIFHWRSFELITPGHLLMHAALLRLDGCGSAPMLEELHLLNRQQMDDLSYFFHSDSRSRRLVLFQGCAPRLTRAALRGTSLTWSESRFLYGITKLQLTHHIPDLRPSFQDLADILHNSPSLHSLTLCHSGPAGGPTEWPAKTEGALSVICVPGLLISHSLRHLTLQFFEPDYAAALIERLVFPVLDRLDIHIEDGCCSNVLRALSKPMHIVKKSLLTGLLHLRIPCLPCQDPAVVDAACKELSNLVVLDIGLRRVRDPWYEQLLVDPEKEGNSYPSFPLLTLLVMTGLDGAQIRKVVESRQDLKIPLLQVVMGVGGHLREEDERWLRDHVDFTHLVGQDCGSGESSCQEESSSSPFEICDADEGEERAEDWDDTDSDDDKNLNVRVFM